MNHDNPTFGDSSEMHEIPHYYGDRVRWLFLAVAAIFLIALPLSPHLTPLLPLWQLVLAVVLVVVAALANPHKRWSVILGVLVAAPLLVWIETVAVQEYAESEMALFLIREAIALALLFGLYYSVKTVRAMIFHQIGKKGTEPHEFDRD